MTKKKLVFIRLRPGANVIKLFTVVWDEWAQCDRVFVFVRPYLCYLLFMSKAGAYPKGAALSGRLLDLPQTLDKTGKAWQRLTL